ncbi:MAG TPA: 6-carboxytetrahydropterin synthase [Chitinophagaceae bacterium]|nr:6-carboxytetrahydropterin synthase [Chitinophagaceae bacterium]
MLSLTKIFLFEMAHAIDGYDGPCKDVHGHSYELHVTVCSNDKEDQYLPAPGFILDFKELKQIVIHEIIQHTDHKLVLSKNFLSKHPGLQSENNLIIWEIEPTAENMLIYFQQILIKKLPPHIILTELRLYETKTSYATWKNNQYL